MRNGFGPLRPYKPLGRDFTWDDKRKSDTYGSRNVSTAFLGRVWMRALESKVPLVATFRWALPAAPYVIELFRARAEASLNQTVLQRNHEHDDV